MLWLVFIAAAGFAWIAVDELRIRRSERYDEIERKLGPRWEYTEEHGMRRLDEPNMLCVTYWKDRAELGPGTVKRTADSWLDFVALLRASDIDYPALEQMQDLAAGWGNAAEQDIKMLGEE